MEQFKTKSADELAKLTNEEQAKYFAEKTANEKELQEKRNVSFQKSLDNISKDITSISEIFAKKEDVKKVESLLKEFKENTSSKEWSEVNEKIEKIKNIIIENELQQKNSKPTTTEPEGLNTLVDKFFEDESIKKYLKNPTGSSPEITLKTFALDTNYTGKVFISDKLSKAVLPLTSKLHLINVIRNTRMSKASATVQKVVNCNNNIKFVTETGLVAETTFDVEEVDYKAKRVGTFMNISQESFKDLKKLKDDILGLLPSRIADKEDMEIIMGDGTATHLDGLWKNSREFSVADISFIATSMVSVAGYDGTLHSLLTFASDHNLYNGYKLTLAATTKYNGTYSIQVVNSTQVILLKAAYVAESTAAWTGVAEHIYKDKFPNANIYNALTTCIADAQTQQTEPTAIILNTAERPLLKAAFDNRLVIDLERIKGVIYVDGIPVVFSNHMPAGNFIIADLQVAVSLGIYQEFYLKIKEDTTNAKEDTYTIVAAKKVALLPVDTRKIIRGNIAAIIADISKP